MQFSDLAQVKVGEVERPKPYPEGKYRAVITGPATEHKAKSGNLALRFPFRPVELVEGDEEALAAAGGIKQDRLEKIDFWMSPDARYRFTEFAKTLGASDDLNIVEAAEHVAGCGNTFLIDAKHRTSEKDPNQVFVDWDNPVGE